MKLITETDCPHCKKTHEAELDLDNFELPQVEKPKMTVKATIPTQTTPIIQPLEQPQTQTQIQTKIKIPSHIPKFKCKNCDKLHDNPDYKKRPRFKCQNCGSLSPEPYCQTCTKGEDFEELDDETLDDLGIPNPTHEHQHEEEE